MKDDSGPKRVEHVKPVILESRVVCKQPGRYIGWPTIAKAAGGELLVVFSGDRDEHVCPFGKTFLTRSSDNGATWSEPVVVNNTPLDDRDAGICACSDGTLVVSWFTAHCDPDVRWPGHRNEVMERWARHAAAVSPEDVVRWATDRPFHNEVPRGHWIRRSSDGGKTWEDPVRVPPTAPHGPIELSDGRLLYVGNEGYDRAGRSTSLLAAESSDVGRTWEVIARVPMFPRCPVNETGGTAYLGEPHVVEAEPGRLVAMVRYEEQPYVESRTRGVLWRFESDDGGNSWTEPRPTDILGKPPHLTRLEDGRLLVTYGYRHEPFGERATFSNDGGRTWDYANEVVLRDDAPNADLGYPASVECDDGTILTVYYQIDKPGEKTCLMSTRWTA
ncbi:sialidase family protein [Verrucomicrobiota bacterium]